MRQDPTTNSLPGNPCTQEKKWFSLVLLGLVLIAMIAIWSARFLPMQDHPQHLFLAFAAANYQDTIFNWQDYYVKQPQFGPYMLFYAVMTPLLMLFDPNIASRIWVSLILLLFLLFTWSEAKRCVEKDNIVPWPILLLVPLSFHQMYFLGFQNYLISIPACLFALRAFQDIYSQPAGSFTWLALFFWLSTVLFAHPYTLLVFITLACSITLFESKQDTPKIFLIIPGGAFLFITVWIFANGINMPSNGGQNNWEPQWIELSQIAEYTALLFSGMRLTDGVSIVHLISWSAILFSVIWAWGSHPRKAPSRTLAAQFIICASGVVLLPFWLGHYSYFSVRLLPFVYLFGALLLTRIAFRWPQIVILCIATTLLVAAEIPRHRQISEEVSSILPIIEEMEANAKVLPVYGHSASKYLDSKYFNQFHQHEHYYYHVLKGGGANPLLFQSTMIPLVLRQNANLPSVNNSLAESAMSYEYVISRGIPTRALINELDCEVLIENKPWALFRIQ